MRKHSAKSGPKSIRAVTACSFVDKLMGLLNRRDNTPLFFRTRFGVHTFGMDRETDIVILDKEWRVVKMRKNLPPNRFFFWNPTMDRVLELPAGFLKKKCVRLGEKLEITF